MIKNKKGFTLVEIMIVVGIIAVLAGIFLVGSGRFRSSANSARIKADLQKLEALQEVYYTGHNTYASAIGDLTQVPASPVSGVTYSTDTTKSCANGLAGKLDDLDADTTSGNVAGDGMYCLTR